MLKEQATRGASASVNGRIPELSGIYSVSVSRQRGRRRNGRHVCRLCSGTGFVASGIRGKVRIANVELHFADQPGLNDAIHALGNGNAVSNRIVAFEIDLFEEDARVFDKAALFIDGEIRTSVQPEFALEQADTLLVRGEVKNIDILAAIHGAFALVLEFVIGGKHGEFPVALALLLGLEITGNDFFLDGVVALKSEHPIGHLSDFGNIAERVQAAMLLQPGNGGVNLD